MDSIDKINLHLTRLGMSGADLEREIGVSNSVYSQWNTKSTKPSKKNLIKVAKLFGVDVAELMPDVGQKENPATESSEVSERDIRLLNWFRSLPAEKQKAILISQDAPKDVLSDLDH